MGNHTNIYARICIITSKAESAAAQTNHNAISCVGGWNTPTITNSVTYESVSNQQDTHTHRNIGSTTKHGGYDNQWKIRVVAGRQRIRKNAPGRRDEQAKTIGQHTHTQKRAATITSFTQRVGGEHLWYNRFACRTGSSRQNILLCFFFFSFTFTLSNDFCRQRKSDNVNEQKDKNGSLISLNNKFQRKIGIVAVIQLLLFLLFSRKSLKDGSDLTKCLTPLRVNLQQQTSTCLLSDGNSLKFMVGYVFIIIIIRSFAHHPEEMR